MPYQLCVAETIGLRAFSTAADPATPQPLARFLPQLRKRKNLRRLIYFATPS